MVNASKTRGRYSRVDAGPPIRHPERTARLLAGDVHVHRRSRRAVPDGILKQREDDPVHLLAITARERDLGHLRHQRDGALGGLARRGLEGAADHLPQIDREALQLPVPGVHGPQGDRLVTQALQPCGAVRRHLQEQLPFLGRHLRLRPEQLQRRAQAMSSGVRISWSRRVSIWDLHCSTSSIDCSCR